jgi:hypothetical protein
MMMAHWQPTPDKIGPLALRVSSGTTTSGQRNEPFIDGRHTLAGRLGISIYWSRRSPPGATEKRRSGNYRPPPEPDRRLFMPTLTFVGQIVRGAAVGRPTRPRFPTLKCLRQVHARAARLAYSGSRTGIRLTGATLIDVTPNDEKKS